MSKILCIETGTDICSVGIAENGQLLALKESRQGHQHAQDIGEFVVEVLAETKLTVADMDAVAVSKGPGSYTGLRIGVSFAKGLCYGQQKPLVAINSLATLTELALEALRTGTAKVENWEQGTLCPMIDARRMEVYTQLFDAQGGVRSEIEAKVIDVDSFADGRAQKPFILFGDGAQKCMELLPDAVLIDVKPSARGLVRLAQQALNEGHTEDIAYFEPLYLKDFVVTTSKKKLF
ncbi:MAG: tRNA (adenosine(37)-N6)-threonylcarbamoyltransferase complex dimerization subunit type 1 TsaB [Alistipes sp.]